MDTLNPAYKHGHAGRGGFSPTYHSWASMLTRCTNAKCKGWEHYGGRGISVCERWLVFENFLADMGERPTGATLDRENNDGNYELGNCRWATRVMQARNSKQVVWVALHGVNKRLVEWCEELGWSINTVRDRVRHYGMTYAEALTTPRKNKPGSNWREKRK